MASTQTLQTFHDHIKELRKRLMWVVLAIGTSAGVSYAVRLRVVKVLQHPLGATLFYTSPAGSFNFILKLSTLIGLFVALPVIIYNLLRFIEPALPVTIKRRTMITIISASFMLALIGIAFSYFYLLPLSLKFFAGYATAQIKPLISVNEYLSFMMGHLITFALVFQIPLVILFINWITPIKPGKLLRYQRHIVVGAFGLAVILPFTYDPISQFIVAIPIVVLFYVSVVLLWIANRKRTYPAEAAETHPAPLPLAAGQPSPQPLLAAQPVLAMAASSQPGVRASMDGFVGPVRQLQTRPAKSLPIPAPLSSTPAPRPSITILHRPRLSIDGFI